MPPADPSLPLFAYGLLKPGELGWLRIRTFVAKQLSGCTATGRMLQRDGLALMAPGTRPVQGALLWFHQDRTPEALDTIADLEAHLYVWDTCRVVDPTGISHEANVLHGQSLHGAHDLEEPWSSRTDPIFQPDVGLDIVRNIATAEYGNGVARESLYLQAAYLMVLTIVERYAAIRYGIGGDVWPKLKSLAKEEAFADALRRHVHREDSIRRSDNPAKKATLDPANAVKSMDYYYAVRSNVTHRGKAGIGDVERLRRCVDGLTAVFGDVLAAAFAEADDVT